MTRRLTGIPDPAWRNFDPQATNPELTCDTILQALQYVFSWMPQREEMAAWFAREEGFDKNRKFGGRLLMVRSPSNRKEWRFIDSYKDSLNPYAVYVGNGTGYLDRIDPSTPGWLREAGVDDGKRWRY